ncbi:succinylglutamate desuccinylase/aspartoacylase family protein [Clostridium ljungdahlii]|uniref:succinylglutamate desuccinylase/aspartoacylase domain-containing protein n=1 Tax=Clostridium ljungdahlii TaxID=1538 RepID=UPI0038686F8F
MQTIKVGNMCAKTGEKVSGYVQVKGTDIELPVTIICGEKEGKTVFISGGGHSADYYIDLHCGDGYEELTPYVYCVGVAAPEVVKAARGMAELVNVPYLVQSPSGSGGSYNYAGSCGIPSILIERGCMGRWSKEEVKLGKRMLEMCCDT